MLDGHVREYAVVPVIGGFADDCVGRALADCFGAPLNQVAKPIVTADALECFGLS